MNSDPIRRFNNPLHPSISGLSSSSASRSRRYDYDGNNQARGILSYNEVMEDYREGEGRRLKGTWEGGGSSREEVGEAAREMRVILKDLDDLESLCDGYQWDDALLLLRGSVLTTTLRVSMTTLRNARKVLDSESRSDVGFDWGSCGWRHCGMLADAEEALAELECRMGLFEPFECAFCIDIARRSVGEALDVVPRELRGKEEGGRRGGWKWGFLTRKGV